MKTCKDCIHYECCSKLNSEFKKYPRDFIYSDLAVNNCNAFRDKSLVLDLPCKVGDTVYVDGNSWSEYACIHYENEFIHSKYFVIGEIVSIVKTKKQLLMKIRVESANHSRYYHKRYTVNAIGKTVFLTRESAEQALKEREQG